jgi:hypothetical protein
MTPPNLDLVAVTIDDVGRRTGLMARQSNDPQLAARPQHKAILEMFCDNGIKAILFVCGIITPPPGPDLPAHHHHHHVHVDDDDDTTHYNIDDSECASPATNMIELVPAELWLALTYYVMQEWFYSIGRANLGEFFMGKYKTELADHRFVGTPATARLPYRPI